MNRFHLVVKGIVQGVGFRHNTRRKARLMNITGWVRNLDSGHVEIEAQGTSADLEQFIHWAHHGPANAIVESVTTEECALQDNEHSFEIR